MGDLKSLAFDFASKVTELCLLDTQRVANRKVSDVNRDVSYISARASAEGLSVYTTLLPRLGRSLDRALATGVEFSVEGFSLYGKLPMFMGDLFRQIFDHDGRLHPEPSTNAVRVVRQIAYLFYKLELEYSKDVVEAKFDAFIELDSQLPEVDSPLSRLSYRTQCVVDRARVLLSRLFDMGSKSHTGRVFDPSDIVPRHGPGSVAGGEEYDQKYHWSTFYRLLDEEYPYGDYFYLSYSHLVDRLWPLGNLKEADAGFARVVAVPKDSRGPRLISMEPLEYQWIQQGLGRALVDWVEHHPLTAGYVNFTDQQCNRDLALYASLTQVFDTLDMKDASDRVSCNLVKALFPPRIWRKLNATRTVGTEVPRRGGVYTLVTRKFAPMGSALCFPVEALVFWALSVATLNPEVCYASARVIPHEKQVYVYGDDMVVPHGKLCQLKPVFEELDLRFNEDKCCTETWFRESCGCDAFRGEMITPVRIKHVGLSPNALVAMCEYARAFSILGYDNVADYLVGYVVSEKGPIPWDASGKLMLSRHCPHEELAQELNLKTFASRFNPTYQRLEIKVLCAVPTLVKRGWPGWEEMFRVAGPSLAGSRYMREPAEVEEDGEIRPLYRWPGPREWVTRLSNLLFPSDVKMKPCVYSVHRVLRLERKWISIHML